MSKYFCLHTFIWKIFRLEVGLTWNYTQLPIQVVIQTNKNMGGPLKDWIWSPGKAEFEMRVEIENYVA